MSVFSDQLVLWVINVVVHSTVLTAILLCVALLFRKRAAMRYWILCSGLLLVLASPAVSALIQSRGSGWLAFAVPGKTVPTERVPAPLQTPLEDELSAVGMSSPASRQNTDSVVPAMREAERPGHFADPAATSASVVRAAVSAEPAVATPENSRSPMEWLAISVTIVTQIWLVGTTLLLLRMTVGWIRLCRILRRAEPIADLGFETAFARACALAGCKEQHKPRLLASAEISGPLAAGLFGGSVVLPKRLIAAASPTELADVLVHEVAHVVRRDQIVVLMQNIVSAIYWPHPRVRKLNRELAKAREEVCDNLVLATTDAPVYSRTLLSLAQLVGRPETIPGSVGFFASRWRLEQRVAGLLDEARDTQTILSKRGWAFVLASTLGLLTAICIGTVTIATAQNASRESATKPDSEFNPMTINGIVHEQNGDPISGAKLWLAVTWHEYNREINIENREGLLRELGSADEQGRFEFVLDAATTREIRHRPRFAQAQLVAMAEGHGMDWLPLEMFEDKPASTKSRDLLQIRIDEALGDGRFAGRTFKLPPESQPVRGRLVDLEGNRLPNVTVFAESLGQPDVPQLLNAFENSWKQGFWNALSEMSVVRGLARSELQKLIPPVTTDASGEFELRGIGDDQLVTLVFKSDRIEARPLHVLGREMKTVSLPHLDGFPNGTKDVFVGRDFTHAVGPSVPVEGVVTDYDTGEPVANVLVSVERLFENEEREQVRLDTRHMRAVTNGQGRFRIIGMPPGDGHIVEAVPPKSAPYLPAPQEVSLSLEDGDAKHIEIQVKRGVWIEGRITDKESGQPRSAAVDYMALSQNPYSRDIPGMDPNLGLFPQWCYAQRYGTDSDGRYRVLGLPGPGVLLVTSLDPGYPLAAGAETIDGYDASGGTIPTTPFPIQASYWHLLKQIDPAADAISLTRDLVFDAGVTIPGRVVGPDGLPISDLFALGLTERDPYWSPKYQDKVRLTDRFNVNGYDGKGPRQLFFKNQDETLVGQYRLEGIAPQEIAVTLQPSVRVTGRLIESETDLPAPRCFLGCKECSLDEKIPPVKFSIHWCHTDDEGRFEIKGLMAGLAYKMYAPNSTNKDNDFTIDLRAAEPGDVIDLGDVIRGTSKQSPRTNAVPRVRGRVLDPIGKPIVAKIWIGGPSRSGNWSRMPTSVVWNQVGTSNDEGRFQIKIPKNREGKASESTAMRIAATVDELGFAWLDLPAQNSSSDVTLRLVDDVPIRGRIVTLDGTPAENVQLDVVEVTAPESLPSSSELFKNAKLSSGVYTNWPAWPGGSPLTETVVTDRDGRFELSGLGRERIVRLQAIRDGLAATRVSVVTREKPSDSVNGAIAVRSGQSESRYFSDFTHVAVPERLIRGTVVDQTSGKPIADVKVVAPRSWASRERPSITDASGKFVIRYVPKATEYDLELSPSGATHFRSQLKVLDPVGSEPLNTTLSLASSMTLRGRVVDDSDANGVQAKIDYNPLFPNEAVESLGVGDAANSMSTVQTDAEGNFAIAVLPGPGAITAEVKNQQFATVHLTEPDLRKIFPEGELEIRPNEFGQIHFLATAAGGQSRGIVPLSRVHAVELLNLNQDEPVNDLTLSLRRGVTLEGEIVDQQGTPVSGTTVVGLGPSLTSITQTPLQTNRFSVTGLLPETKRTLLFLHQDRSLAAMVDVKGDQNGLIKVMLKPTGSVSGSLVDLDGVPIRTGYVSLRPERFGLLTELWDENLDGQGEFTINNLPVGETFSSHVRTDAQRMEMFVRDGIRAEAGETLELGTFRQRDKYRFEPVEMAAKPGSQESEP